MKYQLAIIFILGASVGGSGGLSFPGAPSPQHALKNAAQKPVVSDQRSAPAVESIEYEQTGTNCDGYVPDRRIREVSGPCVVP